MSFRKVASIDSLWMGEMMGVIVGNEKVLLVNIDGAIRAYEDRCPHKGVELSKGRLSGNVLICSAHEWEYDVCSGQGINPASARLREFEVRLDAGDISVDVGDE